MWPQHGVVDADLASKLCGDALHATSSCQQADAGSTMIAAMELLEARAISRGFPWQAKIANVELQWNPDNDS